VKILVLNSGSSSLKYRLFDMNDRVASASGGAERIGQAGSRLTHWPLDAAASDGARPAGRIQDHAEALDRIVASLDASELIGKGETLVGIGHRVAHGGDAFREPTRIDAQVVEAIRALSSLAPLHNPASLLGIEVALERRPDVPQVAVFDTAFHQTLPPRAYRYAVPDDWYESYRVRRYGFHGTSHAYVARTTAAYLERPLEELNLIVLHLGNGASASAIAGGRSVDTSMGLTPLEGLVMGTRSGDLDPAVVTHVARQSGQSPDQVAACLNTESGLRGLCDASDMRDVLARQAAGDSRARLAIDVYAYRIRKYIGAYTAALGRVDAIVFTAGVGEKSPEIREQVCAGLERLGIRVDIGRNRDATDGARAIHAEGGEVQVLVVPTNEELEIAEQTLRCIQSGRVRAD